MRIPAQLLETYVAEIFKGAGCPEDESDRIAFYLVRANLAGHDSHGVIRVPRYLSWMEIGSVKAGVQPDVVSEGPTHAVVDGRFGFGQSVGPFCADIGIAKAEEHGLSIVAIRNSGHLGRIGDWPERAADAESPRFTSSTRPASACWSPPSGHLIADSRPIPLLPAFPSPARSRSSWTSRHRWWRKARSWWPIRVANRCRTAP